MPDHENGIFLVNYDSPVDIALGDGHGDEVRDFSVGFNTISLGDGHSDRVVLFNTQFDVVTLGAGEGDRVLSTAFGSSLTLGNGAHDLFDEFGSVGDIVSIGDGPRDYFVANNTRHDTVSLGSGEGDVAIDNAGRSNTFTLGGGWGDTVSVSHGSGDIISIGDGHYDHFSATGVSDSLANLGNGAGDEVASADGFSNTFTLGDGAGDKVVSAGGDNNTFILGHGAADSVALDTHFDGASEVGVATVTFGGLGATLDLSRTSGPSFVVPTTKFQASVDTSALNKVSGLVSGDHIVMSGGDANHDTLAKNTSNLAGVDNQAVFAAGTYVAAAHTFTFDRKGPDVLLTYDDGTHHFLSVVLVGAAGDIAGSTLHHGTITLG